MLLSNEEKALDAMQDVFVKLIKKEKELMDNSACSLLYRIATNTCLNVLRSEKRKPQNNHRNKNSNWRITADRKRYFWVRLKWNN